MKTPLIIAFILLTGCIAQRLETTSQIVKVICIDKYENCEGIDYFNGVCIYFTPRYDKCNVGRFYILRDIDGEVYTREIKESDIEQFQNTGHTKHEKLFDKKIR
jgi:hypothetical protein